MQKIIIIIKAGFLVIIMYEKVINRPNLDQLLSHGFHNNMFRRLPVETLIIN